MWQGLWKNGKIETVGDHDLQQTINACFYHILSSLPSKRTDNFHGLSPGILFYKMINKIFKICRISVGLKPN